jgi:hypothetical protein
VGDVTFSGASIVVVTGLLTALVGTIAMLFKLLMASKDKSLQDMTEQRNSYQKMAAQSIAALELAANRARKARGEDPFRPIPSVVPEHNSPTTQVQIDTAEYQTQLARATRAARELDLPPLSELPSGSGPEPDAEPERRQGADENPSDDDVHPQLSVKASLSLVPGQSITVSAGEKLQDPTTVTVQPTDTHKKGG